MELRPYQKDVLIKSWKAAVDNLEARSKAMEGEEEITLTPTHEIIDNPGVMLQMPTGSGKTVVGIYLLKLMQQQAPNAINAWLTHRAELRSQSSGRLVEAGMRVSIMNDYKSQDRRWYPGCVNVISPQLRSFPEEIDNPGLLIVDEAHHTLAKTWDRIINMWIEHGGMVIGLTATPWRLSKVQHFEGHYRTLICGPTVEWLQDNNYLARPRVVTPMDALLKRERVRVDGTGDYDQKQSGQQVMQMLGQDRALNHWNKFTEDMDDPRTLWFLPTKESARMLCEKLEEPYGLLLGETPQNERDQMLEDIQYGNITHLVSCEVIGEGVDLPDIPIIASLRMSKSLSVWLQQCGRGSRPKGEPGVEGGVYYVLDYAGNSHELGPPDMTHAWSLKARGKVKPGEQPYATCYKAICIESGVVIHPAHRECWECKTALYWECSDCNQTRRYNQFMKKRPSIHAQTDAIFYEKCKRCREVDAAEARLQRRQRMYGASESMSGMVEMDIGNSGFQMRPSTVMETIQPYDPNDYIEEKNEIIITDVVHDSNGNGQSSQISKIDELLNGLSSSELDELRARLNK